VAVAPPAVVHLLEQPGHPSGTGLDRDEDEIREAIEDPRHDGVGDDRRHRVEAGDRVARHGLLAAREKPGRLELAGRGRCTLRRRLRHRPRWIEHGIPSLTASTQKASSSFEIDVPPAGQVDRITPRMPSCLARRISSIAVSTPRFRDLRETDQALRIGAMNSLAIQLL
jgi:hypothetical protein